MARPLKTGLNYFPLDVDFFSDPKICTVTVEHGVKGQAAAIMLLCAIYRSGYYIPWNAEQCVLILKDLPGVTIAKMQKIVNTLVECQFFDKTLFHQHHVLTSRGIQQRFITAARRRKTTSTSPPLYWLSDDLTAAATPSTTDGTTHPEPGLLPSETPEMPSETPTERNKEIIRNYSELSPSTTRTREAVDQMKKNTPWIEAVCMRHHLSRATLMQRLDEFALDCECRGKPTHDNLSDAQGHFCNWLLITQRQQSNDKTIKTPSCHATHQQITSADYVRDAQQWAIQQSLQFIHASEVGGQPVPQTLPF